MSFDMKTFGFWMMALTLAALPNAWAEMEDPPSPPDLSSLDNLPDPDKSSTTATQDESDALKSLDAGQDAADSLVPPSFDETPPPADKKKDAKKQTKKVVEEDDSADEVEVMPPPPDALAAPADVKVEKTSPAKKETKVKKEEKAAESDEIAPPPDEPPAAEATAKSEEVPPPDASEPTDGKLSQYDVIRGDSLWAISGMGSIYGNSFQWPLLFKANRDNIQDPDLIYPEQKFKVRRDFTEEEIQKAVKNASDTPAYVPHTKPRETLPVDYF